MEKLRSNTQFRPNVTPNSGLFPYSLAEAVPVQVPNIVDDYGLKSFLSFQLPLVQPLIDYHARSVWFLLHQQTQHHSRHLRTTRTTPVDYPVSSRPHAELHLPVGLGRGYLSQSDSPKVIQRLSYSDSAKVIQLSQSDSATYSDLAMMIRPCHSDDLAILFGLGHDDSAMPFGRFGHTVRIRP